ncbi:MAG: GNAT family N-acetyltransferase [Vicinamibacterales bacterium]|jgi:L-amino acid N-acyltransferase YncA|nr:GNAT family N-acetyltransferase [Vicinamibacterales bacterium]
MSNTGRDADRLVRRHADVTVRPVRPDDAEGVAAVLNPIIEARTFTALDTPVTVEAERDFIHRFPTRGIFHVAVADSDQSIVGFQNVEPFAGYTRAFDHVGVIGTYVDLTRRRKGIASRLFNATFDQAPAKRYNKLFAFVRADNLPALFTYLRHGFRAIGNARRHARIDGRFIDEILIERLLP